MSFDDLPPQGSINPPSDAYAAEALRLSRRAAETTRVAMDVAYGPDYWQRMDIYMPADAALRGLPVLMFFHGGGFQYGYKEWAGFTAPAIVTLPAIYISVSYRLTPPTDYPENVKDGFRALRWVAENIASYGGDPGRIFAGGHSAGAHIASLMALRPDWLAEEGLPPDALRGVFPVCGIFRARMIDAHWTVDHPPRLTDVDDAPVELARNARTPFYIVWGGEEPELFSGAAHDMIAALTSAGAEVLGEGFPGEDHFTMHLNTASPDNRWTQTVREWMSRP